VPRMLEIIKQERVSIILGPPYVFGAMAETPEDRTSATSSLRLCLSGGNTLTETSFARFKERFGLPIRSVYGSTETALIAINLEPDDDVRAYTVGVPLPRVQVRITDEELVELPPGVAG